ncbi:MAG: VanW family protein [Clostridiales bacterium]|jgi:vancomycin resistance protein YoaR|nr:VanW family protein [Clostridiales bacterium]
MSGIVETDRTTIETKKLKKKSGSLFKVLICALALVGAAIGIMGFMSYNEYRDMKNAVEKDVIYDNILINGVNVGGMSKDDAEARLELLDAETISKNSIIIKGGGKRLNIDYKDISTSFDYKSAVNEAFEYARKGSLKERYRMITNLVSSPKNITYSPIYSADIDGTRERLEEFCAQLRAEPKNASMRRIDGRFVIDPSQPGEKANVEAAYDMVVKLMQEGDSGEIDIPMIPVEPSINDDDFLPARSLIGSASTYISGSLQNPRNINIATACLKINDAVIAPGEVFSTNAAFGAMNYENGYRLAPVIVSGKLIDDYGGGVCQVSSTLYQALVYAELDIVERQNHSLKVGYADYGYDATLAGDYIDLKFRNDTDYPAFVESYVKDSKVVVNIYGNERHDPSRRIALSNEFISSVSPSEPKIIEDDTLPEGERVVVEAPKTGYKYALKKTIYENSVLIGVETVNVSAYKAINGEIRVGTGAAAVASPYDASADAFNQSADAVTQDLDVTPTDDYAPPIDAALVNATLSDTAPESVPSAEEPPIDGSFVSDGYPQVNLSENDAQNEILSENLNEADAPV